MVLAHVQINRMRDTPLALEDIAASNQRSAAFLIASGTTWIVCALLTHCLPAASLVLAVLFKGALALPMAFAIQELLGFPARHPKNPLTLCRSIWR